MNNFQQLCTGPPTSNSMLCLPNQSLFVQVYVISWDIIVSMICIQVCNCFSQIVYPFKDWCNVCLFPVFGYRYFTSFKTVFQSLCLWYKKSVLCSHKVGLLKYECHLTQVISQFSMMQVFFSPCPLIHFEICQAF